MNQNWIRQIFMRVPRGFHLVREMNHSEFESKFDETLEALVGISGASKPKIQKIIGETVCERYAWALITGARRMQRAFDPYYSQKHELAKHKLIQRLCGELQRAGKRTAVMNEAPTDFGRFDILIIESNPVKILLHPGFEIVVEIKTGLSLNLAQIERYLSSGRMVVLVRFSTEQVVMLRPSDYQRFLVESSQDRLDVLNRLLNNRALEIPGEECFNCQISDCDHNQQEEKCQRPSIITPRDFSSDLCAFLDHLYPCINKAVRLILSELATCSVATSALRQTRVEEAPSQPVLSSQALSQPRHPSHP